MNLSFNSFKGTIPPSIGNLSTLRFLNLAANKLAGQIPHSLGRIGGLRFLYLAENSLFGKIPLSIYNLSFLEVISLTQNHLQGYLPISILKTKSMPPSDPIMCGGDIISDFIPQAAAASLLTTSTQASTRHLLALVHTSLMWMKRRTSTLRPISTLLHNRTIRVTGFHPSNFTLDDTRVTHPDVFNNDVVTIHSIGGILDYKRYGSRAPSLEGLEQGNASLSWPPLVATACDRVRSTTSVLILAKNFFLATDKNFVFNLII